MCLTRSLGLFGCHFGASSLASAGDPRRRGRDFFVLFAAGAWGLCACRPHTWQDFLLPSVVLVAAPVWAGLRFGCRSVGGMPGQAATLCLQDSSLSFQSGTLWETYHDRNGLMQQQRTSRHIGARCRTNHPILRNVLEQEVTEQNSRMDQHAQYHTPSKILLSLFARSEWREEAHLTLRRVLVDVAAMNHLGPLYLEPWLNAGEKHWSQVTEPPGSHLESSEAEGPSVALQALALAVFRPIVHSKPTDLLIVN